jgi:hypothetical protein
MTITKSKATQIQKAIDELLSQIIDEWYERVSPHYVTHSVGSGRQAREEELKCFHDKNGHRIKFDKDGLDFTYGLKSQWAEEHCVIEISVNNKVENFDYLDFQRRLVAHYQTTGSRKVTTPYQLRAHSYQEIFQLEPNLEEAFSVENREKKADIMSLSFRLRERFSEELAARPVSGKQLIEDYCVSPFRSAYAAVYRRKSR